MRYKKWMSAVLSGALFISSVGTSFAAAENTVQSKLETVEVETYGAAQTGAFLNRINRIEKDYLGKHNAGSMLERVNLVYGDIYDNSMSPGLLTQLNAVEWGITHEVSSKPVDTRITDMEMQIAGTPSEGTYQKRISTLGEHAFGSYEVPLEEVTVPADTLIKIALAEEVNVKNVKVKDIVRYRVAEDVVLDGMLVFAKGQPGTGTVMKVKQAQNFGRNAELEVDFHTTKAMDGTDVTTHVGEKSKETMESYAMAAGASIAGMVILGPVGIIGGAFIKGKNIKYPEGTELYIQTKEDTVLYGVPTSAE
ncbi:hypothetical protein TAMA11512_18210 [Selenomonas sp. TAMA-11512]|uniref:hypothetical protein n=1 Tax=Selenomonas sp. TAMA-11512 TaxID=3095337 RepID=UPI0030850FC2|nr:hypothetical protein TAMA11512_18210 [Selenomonas sp. TAMA-11512]